MMVYEVDNRMALPHDMQREPERGFTLIEMMIAMAIGLMILLGMVMMFSADSKVTNTMASRTERLSDLYLVSQIMQSELRNAQSGTISWSSNTLAYTDQDGVNGYFEYQRTSDDRLYWRRPTASNYEELIRDLNTSTGVAVSGSAGNIWTVTLKSSYQNENRETKNLELSFKVWARN